MVLKKSLVFLFLLLILVQVVSASLEIEKKAVIDSVVPETKQPAVYDLEIKNLGETDDFSVYSLVGVDIKPNETFRIASGETKNVRVELFPQEAVLENPGTFNFIYKVKGEKTGITEDVMLIRVINLKDALEINSYNINLDADKAVVYVRSRVSLPFPEIKAEFHSAFFNFEKNFSLDAHGEEEFETALDKEKIKGLVAGSYIITTNIETYNVKDIVENSFWFSEKEDIKTSEEKSGFLISKIIVEKTNIGNIPTLVQVNIKKNIISRLFTNFNTEPTRAGRDGFMVNYVFQKEIKPAEVYTVRITTNWFYPLLILIFIIIIVYLVKAYNTSYLLVKKRVSFVKTKGGEFALKVNLIIRARKFVEKINILDKVPGLVKIHERFGTFIPNKIDEKNKRLEWNIDSLQPGEERIFSYVIYSKIAPVGKFELPKAVAVFERDGKIHETESNRVFFLTEPRKREEWKGE